MGLWLNDSHNFKMRVYQKPMIQNRVKITKEMNRMSIEQQIEELKRSFSIEEVSPGQIKVYMYVSNELNFELDIDLTPIGKDKKPKIGFEKQIKDLLGNINQTLTSMANWGSGSTVSEVLYELEERLMESATAQFTVMDEIYTLVGNYGPKASFEGKVATVKITDIRKNDYLITIDCADYPKLDMKFQDKLAERIGAPEDLPFTRAWSGHLFELVAELEYRLDLYERINFEYQILNKFSSMVNKDSLMFNPVTGYISGDVEGPDGEVLELDLDYMNGYPQVQPRAIMNVRPDNPAKQSQITKLLAEGAESWNISKIFMLTVDKIVQAIFGKRMINDLKTNKPLEGDLWTCEKCGAQFLKSSHDREGEKFRCEYCYFGDIKRKKEKLIDDLLGKYEG